MDFSDYTPIDFMNKKVFWAKVLEDQADWYKGRAKWSIDICLDDDMELFEELEDNDFRVKTPRRKILKLKDSDDEKEQLLAKQEEDRGHYIQAIANADIPLKDEEGTPTGERQQFDPIPIWDENMEPWPEDKPIGNGSIVNIEAEAKQWEGQSQVTLYLVGIQVVEHVEYEGGTRRKAGASFKKIEK